MDKSAKKNLLLRILAFLATAILVLATVFLVANWQKLNFDYIRRWWAYRSLDRNEQGEVESYPYAGGVNSTFGKVGDDLLVCSPGSIHLYSPSGTACVAQTCSMSAPILSTAGNTGLVYDAGGSTLYVFRDRALAFTFTSQEGYSILCASLNAQGRLTVATQASGVKGAVTVYDSSFQPVFGVNLSSRFITDAILSPDGSTLALATAGQTGGIYDSQISFYSLSRSEGEHAPDAVCSLGSNTILKLSWPSQPLRVLGEEALVFLNADGTQAGSYSYDWRYLKGYSLDGESSCALLLGRARAGTTADLVTVDLSGQETAALLMEQQVLSLSAAGRYLSVLTVDDLTIYQNELTVYHTTEDLLGARKVLQHADGSATLIAADSARLYLPD